jgi:Tfp pilus assembly protein FimT
MKNLNRTVSKIGHYTIVEMMMVIAIFMIILSMTMVAWLNSGDQAKLRNAARLVSAQLNLARAKAVADCKEVGVYFSDTGNAREKYAMLICEKGDKNKRLPGEDWVQLPGGILFSANQPDDNPVSATAPGAIKFRSDGSLTQDSNRADFYLAPGDAKNSKLNKDAVSYYKIEINEFTGRSKLTFIETED